MPTAVQASSRALNLHFSARVVGRQGSVGRDIVGIVVLAGVSGSGALLGMALSCVL